jgi:HPt (histidine-containing phosphotransfer) domain-containing protein
MQTPEVLEAARNRVTVNKEPVQEEAPQEEIDRDIAEIFARDAVKALATLDSIHKKNDYENKVSLRTYVVNVHGIKSALANIGKKELSAVALKLETAGREENMDIILSETPAFLASLRTLLDEISSQAVTIPEGTLDEDIPFLREKLTAISAACEDFDENTADILLGELKKKSWSKGTGEILGTISEHLLHSDFDEIIYIILKFMGSED